MGSSLARNASIEAAGRRRLSVGRLLVVDDASDGAAANNVTLSGDHAQDGAGVLAATRGVDGDRQRSAKASSDRSGAANAEADHPGFRTRGMSS
jgi:hypothetical protein